MGRGKSINLFLMDGTATGRMKCTLANWTGVAYKIPRTALDLCKERDDLKQSGIYFAIVCVTLFPIAYITNWMKHNAIGILSYVGIFVAIFVITWLVQYFVWKRKVKRMNDGVRKSNNAK